MNNEKIHEFNESTNIIYCISKDQIITNNNNK